MDNIVLKAYGKINLGLDVLGKRPDGYHEVRMIMQTVGLFDLLTMEKTEQDQISMNCSLSFLPTDEKNLVYRAVALMKEKYHITSGVKIDLKKRIPVAAGMAGGSADCAAALKGMNQLFDLGLSVEELCETGVLLGADVPYCIWGGTALAEGIGEKLSKLPPMPKCWILIAKPGISVSTAFVYNHLRLDLLEHHPEIDAMMEDLRAGSLSGICEKLENVLETVTIPEYPIIDRVKKYLKEQGAMGALMSGS
jgi:4-diphosphocytidyl-2-C-methyl-D-erythritol kinase